MQREPGKLVSLATETASHRASSPCLKNGFKETDPHKTYSFLSFFLCCFLFCLFVVVVVLFVRRLKRTKKQTLQAKDLVLQSPVDFICSLSAGSINHDFIHQFNDVHEFIRPRVYSTTPRTVTASLTPIGGVFVVSTGAIYALNIHSGGSASRGFEAVGGGGER